MQNISIMDIFVHILVAITHLIIAFRSSELDLSAVQPMIFTVMFPPITREGLSLYIACLSFLSW